MKDPASATYWFLVPLIAGFCSHLASACTSAFSRKWGNRIGTFISIILRDVTGIPLWAFGFFLAVKESSDLIFQPGIFLRITGWGLIFLGGLVIIIALASIRIKAAAPKNDDTLVRDGIYSVIRHPIHAGSGIEFTGVFLLWPTLKVAIALALGFIWIMVQSRLEEKDLQKRIPGYKEYAGRLPRFFPGLFRKKN